MRDFVFEVTGKYYHTSTQPSRLQNTIPLETKLYQNYPNPFNATTKIYFDLKNDLKATIRIFNILGQEVMLLLDEFRKAGRHYVNFNSENLASGVYFYRMQAGDYVNTKKMLVVK